MISYFFVVSFDKRLDTERDLKKEETAEGDDDEVVDMQEINLPSDEDSQGQAIDQNLARHFEYYVAGL